MHILDLDNSQAIYRYTEMLNRFKTDYSEYKELAEIVKMKIQELLAKDLGKVLVVSLEELIADKEGKLDLEEWAKEAEARGFIIIK